MKIAIARWSVLLGLALAWPAAAQVTAIQHVVLIIKENHSFDNMFGTVPGVNGATHGTVSSGKIISLRHSPDEAFNFAHDWLSTWNDIDGGLMDNFDQERGCHGPGYRCYSQYLATDIPNYFSYAQNYLIADNFFQSLAGPSYPNHQYLIASQSANVVSNPLAENGRSIFNWGCDAASGTLAEAYDPATQTYSNVRPCFDYETLGDVLTGAGISWKYYAPPPKTGGYQWSAYDAIKHIRYGTAWKTNIVKDDQFVTDASAAGSCHLPAVTWLVPESGDSEHPPASMTAGENWTVTQLNALMRGPCWPSTAIFLLWDDHGGFYDHVPPPSLDPFGAGIRVPLLIISPFVKPGTVYSKFGTFDSLLAFVEANWSLHSLTQRDASANNLMDAFQSHAAAAALVLPLRKAKLLTPRQRRALDGFIARDHDQGDTAKD